MRLKKSTIGADYLAQIGEEAFPAVNKRCPKCGGQGYMYESVHGVKERCDLCRGMGVIVRDMTAREEHFWIIHLLKHQAKT